MSGLSRPEFKPEKQSFDSHFNPLTNTQFSLRPPIEYAGSQLDSQQSYSQAVLTQSQNSQQFSQNSGEDFGLANNAWGYGSRARDLINKRPRPSQFPHNNSKDGSNLVLASQESTAQTLLQQVSNRPRPTGKYILTDEIKQRLMAMENCLNGIFGRLDDLQKNLLNVEGTVKEAARESDISRRKAALEQNGLKSMVDALEKWKRGETMHDELESLKLEEISEEVKKIPTSVGEQITELKDELLESLKSELQVILNWRPQGVQDHAEQVLDVVNTRSTMVRATKSVQTLSNIEPLATSSRSRICDKEVDPHLRVEEMYDSSRVTATAKKANGAHDFHFPHGSEGYRVSPQPLDSRHTQIPQDGGWRTTRSSKTKAIMTEQLPRSPWMESKNDDTNKNVKIRPEAQSHNQKVSGKHAFNQCEPITDVMTVKDVDPWIFPSQVRSNRRKVEGYQKVRDDCLDASVNDVDGQIRQKTHQTLTTLTKTRLQRRASRYSVLD